MEQSAAAIASARASAQVVARSAAVALPGAQVVARVAAVAPARRASGGSRGCRGPDSTAASSAEGAVQGT